MKPLIYGYMRVWPKMSRSDIEGQRAELAEYANREGFCLAYIFVEEPALRSQAFDALIAAIKESGAANVVVSALTDFARLPGPSELVKTLLERGMGVQVWVLRPKTEESQR